MLVQDNHASTTVFTGLGLRWVFLLPKTKDTDKRKAYRYDWASKNRIKSCWRYQNPHFKSVSRIGKKRWHKCIISEGVIDLTSHTTYVVCVYFIHEWRDLQFQIDSERQIFLRNFSWQFVFTLRVFARNLLRGHRRRNTFRILFWCLAWGSNPGFTSNKPTHFLLDHGNFKVLPVNNGK